MEQKQTGTNKRKAISYPPSSIPEFSELLPPPKIPLLTDSNKRKSSAKEKKKDDVFQSNNSQNSEEVINLISDSDTSTQTDTDEESSSEEEEDDTFNPLPSFPVLVAQDPNNSTTTPGDFKIPPHLIAFTQAPAKQRDTIKNSEKNEKINDSNSRDTIDLTNEDLPSQATQTHLLQPFTSTTKEVNLLEEDEENDVNNDVNSPIYNVLTKFYRAVCSKNSQQAYLKYHLLIAWKNMARADFKPTTPGDTCDTIKEIMRSGLDISYLQFFKDLLTNEKVNIYDYSLESIMNITTAVKNAYEYIHNGDNNPEQINKFLSEFLDKFGLKQIISFELSPQDNLDSFYSIVTDLLDWKEMFEWRTKLHEEYPESHNDWCTFSESFHGLGCPIMEIFDSWGKRTGDASFYYINFFKSSESNKTDFASVLLDLLKQCFKFEDNRRAKSLLEFVEKLRKKKFEIKWEKHQAIRLVVVVTCFLILVSCFPMEVCNLVKDATFRHQMDMDAKKNLHESIKKEFDIDTDPEEKKFLIAGTQKKNNTSLFVSTEGILASEYKTDEYTYEAIVRIGEKLAKAAVENKNEHTFFKWMIQLKKKMQQLCNEVNPKYQQNKYISVVNPTNLGIGVLTTFIETNINNCKKQIQKLGIDTSEWFTEHLKKQKLAIDKIATLIKELSDLKTLGFIFAATIINHYLKPINILDILKKDGELEVPKFFETNTSLFESFLHDEQTKKNLESHETDLRAYMALNVPEYDNNVVDFFNQVYEILEEQTPDIVNSINSWSIEIQR